MAEKEKGAESTEKVEKAEKKEKKPAGAAGEGKKKRGPGANIGVPLAETSSVSPKQEPRLKKLYREQVVPALMKEFQYSNAMQVPRLEKVVINCAVKEAVGNPKVLDSAMEDLMWVTGQRPVLTRAKKSIATFKVREGNALGVAVTLRRARMWEFLDRLMNVALPRVRDFKGVNDKSFDGRGNYSLGLKEQIIFPEIDYDKVDNLRGMTITVVTTTDKNEQARAMLRELGMPFRK